MLEVRGTSFNIKGPYVVKVVTSHTPNVPKENRMIMYDDTSASLPFSECAVIGTVLPPEQLPERLLKFQKPLLCSLPADHAFQVGDIALIEPSGRLVVLYQAGSKDNTLFLTNQCNSRCIMCPQPPTDTDDCNLLALAKQMIPLIDPDCEIVGITGGEPTLLGEGLLEIIAMLRDHLPMTMVHLLTNGRLLSSGEAVEKLRNIEHPLLSIGIPLCSDNPYDHDMIVSAKGAFCETVLALHELAKQDINVEIRMVLVSPTISRLQQMSQFVWSNFPFVAHVCFMGMEPTGLAWENREKVWMDPAEYQESLESAVEYLSTRGIRVSIYNEQLCVLRPSLWKYACKSISGWKRLFLPKCDACSQQGNCGGLFSSGEKLHSRALHALH